MKLFVKLFLICSLLICFASGLVYTQEKPNRQTITVVPNKSYKAGWLHNLFFGKHWRDLWTTPVDVEILDLKEYGGGLTPFRIGGGQQTKSLRLKGNDGIIYKFRSVLKDASKVLPEEVRESVAADILDDQISSANPYAPIIVSKLLDAVGIMNTNPKMVYMPDTELLGKFRDDFKNMLGTIEIHPEANRYDADPDFSGSDKVIGTFKLLKRLLEKTDEKVDSKEYLKARLIDIFIGDWDRHTDQWRWARFDDLWRPIPRDRDQAFAKFDGLLPSITEYIVPQFVHFDQSYPQLEDLSWSGRYLDRRFLTETTKHVWDSIAVFVQEKITDSIIVASVQNLPDLQFQIVGKQLIKDLIVRKNNLQIASNQYYKLLNKVVDIHLSNKNDSVLINRINNENTELTAFRVRREKNKSTLLYHKIFNNNFTNEIRLFLHDGDDNVYIKGEVDDGISIRAIGGDGKDKIIDSSIVNGYFLSVLPFNKPERKVQFYDSGKKTKIQSIVPVSLDKTKLSKPKNDFERYEPRGRDRGHDWMVNPLFELSSDDGLIFGGGVSLYSFNFRSEPYEYKMKMNVAYASIPKSYRANFYGEFYSLVDDAILEIDLMKSELTRTKYYGYGNETGFLSSLENNDYYKASVELIHFQPKIKLQLSKNYFSAFSFSFDYLKTSLANEILLERFPIKNYGLGKLNLLGIHYTLGFDNRTTELVPKKGVYINLNGSLYPKLMDNISAFASALFDIRYYYSFSNTTLAFRTGGERVWGDYPFQKSAFLGGSENLRGFSKGRFAGDASLFGQFELRINLGKIKIILPADIGLIALAESGRVFIDGGKSRKWHSSFGGGIWFSMINGTFNSSFIVSASNEKIGFFGLLSLPF